MKFAIQWITRMITIYAMVALLILSPSKPDIALAAEPNMYATWIGTSCTDTGKTQVKWAVKNESNNNKQFHWYLYLADGGVKYGTTEMYPLERVVMTPVIGQNAKLYVYANSGWQYLLLEKNVTKLTC